MTGLQSWIHGDKEYYIEYYFSNNSKITTAYGDKEIWAEVLNILHKNV